MKSPFITALPVNGNTAEPTPVNAEPSPLNFVASTLPNEPVEVDEPLIFVPKNS